MYYFRKNILGRIFFKSICIYLRYYYDYYFHFINYNVHVNFSYWVINVNTYCFAYLIGTSKYLFKSKFSVNYIYVFNIFSCMISNISC